MKGIISCLLGFVLCLGYGGCVEYENVTLPPASRQLLDFKLEHPVSIGLWTKSSGEPTEIRDTVTLNSDIFNNQLLLDTLTLLNGERIPERIVHAKGTGAYGYFEVTNDVSKYTYADVFNGIGKKTPVVVRFSSSLQNIGGNDLAREVKGLAVKMYTKEGNLDFTCLQTPIYFYRDAIHFHQLARSFKRNPVTNLFDFTAIWDAVSLNPILAHSFFYVLSDIGITDGYRKMDAFPIHAFELANKNGKRHYVRFNFRTELGVQTLTTEQAAVIAGQDPDYYTRDLYNAIKNKEYPTWRVEMDVMSLENLKKVDYDPFDVTRLWKNGTYFTVQIGRLVLNRNVDNMFKDIEQSAFNPSNLVPGIPGPVDFMFKARKMFYRDTQNYRLGRNHNRIQVNMPLYAKTMNRDGKPPLRDNERDAPNYYPNGFNGVVPYVDERMPKEKMLVLQSNGVDLEPLSEFYNVILGNEAHRQRFIGNVVQSLVPVVPEVQRRVIELLFLIDQDFGSRVSIGLEVALAQMRAEQTAQTTATTAGPILVPQNNTQKIPH